MCLYVKSVTFNRHVNFVGLSRDARACVCMCVVTCAYLKTSAPTVSTQFPESS